MGLTQNPQLQLCSPRAQALSRGQTTACASLAGSPLTPTPLHRRVRFQPLIPPDCGSPRSPSGFPLLPQSTVKSCRLELEIFFSGGGADPGAWKETCRSEDGAAFAVTLILESCDLPNSLVTTFPWVF